MKVELATLFITFLSPWIHKQKVNTVIHLIHEKEEIKELRERQLQRTYSMLFIRWQKVHGSKSKRIKGKERQFQSNAVLKLLLEEGAIKHQCQL